jgi:transposase
LFYQKISEVISYHLALEADKIFDSQIELDEAIWAVIVKKNEVKRSRKSCRIRFVKATRIKYLMSW